jgi:hypothetical protein
MMTILQSTHLFALIYIFEFEDVIFKMCFFSTFLFYI